MLSLLFNFGGIMIIKAKQVPESAGLAGDLSISGRIVRVFEKKEGDGEHGHWSFQNVIVADDTGEMTVCFKNRKETLTSKDADKTISAKSKETKNGILGVKVEKEEYEDSKGEKKSTIKVILTGSAIVEIEGSSKEPTAEIKVVPIEHGDSDKMSKKEWEAKERRDFRSRALAQVSGNIKVKEGEKELDWALRVFEIADLFVGYIYMVDEK